MPADALSDALDTAREFSSAADHEFEFRLDGWVDLNDRDCDGFCCRAAHVPYYVYGTPDADYLYVSVYHFPIHALAATLTDDLVETHATSDAAHAVADEPRARTAARAILDAAPADRTDAAIDAVKDALGTADGILETDRTASDDGTGVSHVSFQWKLFPYHADLHPQTYFDTVARLVGIQQRAVPAFWAELPLPDDAGDPTTIEEPALRGGNYAPYGDRFR